MITEPFTESSMTFGPYPEGHCFRIETSALYKAIQDNNKIAEFLFLKLPQPEKPVIWIIEAKTSGPDLSSDQENDSNFIDSVTQKFTNTLQLFIAAHLNRHPNSSHEIHDCFKQINLGLCNFCFILIIKNHKAASLPPVKEALYKKLKPFTKIWGLSPSSVVVLNDSSARKHELIQ